MASVKLPIETDAAAVTELGRNVLRAVYPGIAFPPASLLAALTAAAGEMAAYGRDALSEHDDFIFERLGTTILGVPYNSAQPAIAASTWTLSDTDGWTIPAGTEITLRGLDDTRVGFETVDEVTIPPGSSATTAGQVILRAVSPGAAGNGLSADPQPENAITRLASIALTGATSGGKDAEDRTAYLTRLAREQRVAYPKLVVAADAELLVQDVAGIDRALVLDTYDPDTGTFGNPGMMAICAIDAAGDDVDDLTVGAELDDYLAGRHISGAVINRIASTRTNIDVTVAGVAHDGYNTDDVEAAVTAALQSFLSPANWGLPYTGTDRRWVYTPKVRYGDIWALIESVEGFDYTSTPPLLNGGTDDVTLAGAAPLPTPHTLSVTVTAP